MNKKDRYVYIKNGDVVAQLQRIEASGDAKITSGPDAFIYDFLSKIHEIPVFVASRSSRNAIYKKNNITARIYTSNGNIVLKSFRRLFATIDLFFRILFYRPTKIICGTKGGFLWVSYLLSRINYIPIVYSCHNRVIDQSNGLLKHYAMVIDNWCIRHCDSVICHGPYLREQLITIDVPASKIHEFDVEFTDLSRNSEIIDDYEISRIAEYQKYILYVGRIEKEKGVFDLLDACSEALSIMPDLSIVYIGKGSALEELKKTAERLKLTNKVRFLGYINHEKIVAIIKNSTLLVAPTRKEFPEGRCMSVMEGLILGVPVVAPDFGPFPYLIRHNINGLLYAPNSTPDLRKKIEGLLNNTERYKELKTGARVAGERLMIPEMTFGEAVCRALSE